MKTKQNSSARYIVFLFVLTGIPPPFFPRNWWRLISRWRFFWGEGGVAIILQKKVQHEKFVDLGFRLNRNALIGLGFELTFFMLLVLVTSVIPYFLGIVSFSVNEESIGQTLGISPLLAVVINLIFLGGV